MKTLLAISLCLISTGAAAQRAAHSHSENNLPGQALPAVLFPDEMKSKSLFRSTNSIEHSTPTAIHFPSTGVTLPAFLFPDERDILGSPTKLEDPLNLGADSIRRLVIPSHLPTLPLQRQ